MVTKLLARFFWRRVLSVGILRSRIGRFGIGLFALLSILGLTAIATLYLRDMLSDMAIVQLLFQVASVSATFWTIIAFIFVKILFMKSHEFLRLTFQLPITNHERSAAMLLYEMSFASAVALVLFIPASLAVIIQHGLPALMLVLGGVVFPALTLYLFLALTYNVIFRLAEALRMVRMSQLIVSIIFVFAVFFYNSRTPAILLQMSDDYLNEREAFYPTAAYISVLDNYGPIAMMVLFFGCAAVLVSLALGSAPKVPPIVRQFVKFPLVGFARYRVVAFVAAIARRWELWLASVIAYLCFLSLVTSNSPAQAPYALLILLVQSIYAYVGVAPLRRLAGPRVSAWSEYLLIVSSQLLVLLLLALPVILGSQIAQIPLAAIGWSLLACASSVLSATLIGIVFPPEKDNPFTVLVGLGALFAVVGILGVMVGILSLPAAATIAILVGAHGVVVAYGVAGIQSLRRKARYEASNGGS
ncbi:hypothetical protein [Micromonospora endophytica]|uniref:hypothetical protein n=1 Tax=Micromonospora endophytica TaxID=515350 RepID=UPI0011B65BED|nr:hypothetical protein [Micromonospora endophytica]